MSASSLTIRPMSTDEFERWSLRSRAGYANDMIQNAGVEPDVAERKSAADFERFLPDGRTTAGHVLLTLEVEGEWAGDLWLAERDGELGPTLFVFDVRVDEAQRGRGYGKQAMLFAEEEARRRGLPAVSLNVFGGNDAARGLYRSLGYREDAVHMSKRV